MGHRRGATLAGVFIAWERPLTISAKETPIVMCFSTQQALCGGEPLNDFRKQFPHGPSSKVLHHYLPDVSPALQILATQEHNVHIGACM